MIITQNTIYHNSLLVGYLYSPVEATPFEKEVIRLLELIISMLNSIIALIQGLRISSVSQTTIIESGAQSNRNIELKLEDLLWYLQKYRKEIKDTKQIEQKKLIKKR